MTSTAHVDTVTTIETTGLAKRFGRTPAVAGVDLQIGHGVVGLLGPNGAGKTTLLRMLGTVLAPDEGSLRLLGRNPAVAHERVEIRRRLGYLPQSPQLYGSFTALELVDYVAVLKEHTDRGVATTRVHPGAGGRGDGRPDAQEDQDPVGRHASAGRPGGRTARRARAAAARRAGHGTGSRATARAAFPAGRHGEAGHRAALDPQHDRGGGAVPAGGRSCARAGSGSRARRPS